MLSAVHLARGGTHITLNFDVGIEIAYHLLTGRAELPTDAPAEFRQLLPRWQRLVPADTPPLLVAASRAELNGWDTAGRPPALLKPHGSLTLDQTSLVDVVVVDIEELGQLTAGRRAAVQRVTDADVLLITGYSGGDPDVYRPLLDAAPTHDGHRTTWRCFSLADDSPVHADTGAHGIGLVLGAPGGLATTALRDVLGLSGAPAWPELTIPQPAYEERFRDWAHRFTQAHSPAQFAGAWAWLAADLGNLDIAEEIASRLAVTGDVAAQLRHAEILYTRARGSDRDNAARLFHEIGRDQGVSLATRTHCMLRAGDVARGRAIRGKPGPATAVYLARAFAEPARVLLLTGNGRREQEAAADAYRALQQTGLRGLERAAAAAPLMWPALAVAARAIAAAAARRSPRGQRQPTRASAAASAAAYRARRAAIQACARRT